MVWGALHKLNNNGHGGGGGDDDDDDDSDSDTATTTTTITMGHPLSEDFNLPLHTPIAFRTHRIHANLRISHGRVGVGLTAFACSQWRR